MGMMSYLKDENVEVKDWDGLVKFFKFWERNLKENHKGQEWERVMSSKAMLNKKDKTISFGSWDDIKLISYWYDVELLFLELISEYIEGDVDWEFESDDESGRVNFENGKCIITTGQMSWNEWKPIESIREELPAEIKKRLILKELK